LNAQELTWLWIPATLIAAACQVGRNAIQRGLTEKLGTIGATQVRFLYGFPFAIVFAAIVLWLTGSDIPQMDLSFFIYICIGAVAQILGTALMLGAMRQRAFVVVTAWTKTEPIQVALFGVIVLGEHLSIAAVIAIMISTVGVLLMIRPPLAQEEKNLHHLKSIAMGILAGTSFAIAAVDFRGAILSLHGSNFLAHASWALVFGLGIQALILTIWMIMFRREALLGCLKAWRISIWGGLLGACASQFWFIGFALTIAANVRTLGLVEILFAQILTWRVFLTKSNRNENIGIILIVVGMLILLSW